MKKSLFLLLFVAPIICFSQTSFSCHYVEVCAWNSYEESWENCTDADKDNSLFVMNSSETMFTHTTTDAESTYYVKEAVYTKEQSDKGFFAYEVISDAGNAYYFIFDMTNKEVKAVSTSGDVDDWYLLRWYVKSIF